MQNVSGSNAVFRWHFHGGAMAIVDNVMPGDTDALERFTRAGALQNSESGLTSNIYFLILINAICN